MLTRTSKTAFHFTLLLLVSQVVKAQTSQQLQNVQAFNKLYGYVRFFHPSDEAALVDWDRFAVYGCSKVLAAKNDDELETILKDLFVPIAPSVTICQTKDRTVPKPSNITPPDPEGYKLTNWQHLGVQLGEKSNIYKSVRVNRDGSEALFDNKVALGDYISKDIGADLKVTLPLALYANQKSTYPKADSLKLSALLSSITSEPADIVAERLGALVITWNIFQHFYPYFDVVKTDWAENFRAAVKEAFNQSLDFRMILQKLTANLKDGHIRVNLTNGMNKNGFALPLNWEWVQDKLVVTELYDESLPIAIGDVVIEIQEAEVNSFFNINIYPYISASTKGWLNLRACQDALFGGKDSSMKLTIRKADGSKVSVMAKRTLPINQYYSRIRSQSASKKISEETYYLNLSRSSLSDIETAMPELQGAKNIICDLRGYPNNNLGFLEYLLSVPDTSAQWMQVDHILYPDHERMTTSKKGKWSLMPKKPHINGRIFFLTNARAISFSESVLSFVEHYNLGTLIGEPTAGTNGNINTFVLPGGYTVTFTGMRVLKHDGSQHHGVGIVPDIIVRKTIEGIRNRRDEVLDKALELSSK